MRWPALTLMLLLAGGCANSPPRPDRTSRPATPGHTHIEEGREVRLPVGHVAFDLYLPPGEGKAPLILVAHGFSRSRHNMKYWGARLASAGFLVAIPTAPRWIQQDLNAEAMADLAAYLAATEARVDPWRLGLVGFSAGGYQTLRAAESLHAKVWVGLDPVLTGDLPADQARQINSAVYVLRAEPAVANLRGNFRQVQDELPQLKLRLVVTKSLHVDPEWPTDGLAQMAMGRTSDRRREVFIDYTVAALQWELLADQSARAAIQNALQDRRVHDAYVAMPDTIQAISPH